MYISIPPVITGLVIIVVLNLIMSFGENRLMKKTYILISSLLSVIGIFGIIATRSMLVSTLDRNLSYGRLDAEFISWAIKKFDSFAFVSIALTCLLIITLLCLLLINKNRRNRFVFSSASAVVNIFRLFTILAAIWYSMETINKVFDLASYISILSISELLALYIPLTVRRMLLYKR